MKFYKLSWIVFSFVFVLAGAAMAADYVDIGNVPSETAHNAQGWGPIEPATNPGSWGGIADWGGTCRVIWDSSDNDPLAEVDMAFTGLPEIVSFKHLNGPADDSFDVWIENTNVYSYSDSGDPGEYWHVDGFSYTPLPGAEPKLTVAFVATGQAWPSFGTYGQVAFEGVWVAGGPVSLEKGSWGSVKSLFR
ncbi:MAG: hypothetical protein DRP71_17855 [Verrucomicrobia bacterium]|nr:MAG: hypothetical protein DRP71_17855 [Verrucomicrobiota bacterium]